MLVAITVAYIDPGAGGALMQLLLGGTAGLAVLLKLYWGRICGWFGRPSSNETKTEADPPTR